MQVRLSSGDYKGGGWGWWCHIACGRNHSHRDKFYHWFKKAVIQNKLIYSAPLQPFRATTAPFCTGQRFSFNLSPSSLLRTACETWYTFCQRYEACFNGH